MQETHPRSREWNRKLPLSAHPDGVESSGWRNPWLFAIVGGTIAAIVAGVVLALVL
jgi:hypothetical protein